MLGAEPGQQDAEPARCEAGLGLRLAERRRHEGAPLVGERIRIVDASSVHLADEDGPAHISELYLDPEDHRAWAAGALRLDDGYVLRSVARCVRMLATNAPAVIGAALPPWPDTTPAAFRASIDDLPGAGTLARATTALQALLPELACPHRSHPG